MHTASLGALFSAVLLYTNGIRADTNCKNSLISKEWREEVLKIHNDKRKILSRGNQNGKNGPLPTANNMNQLYWDCVLEDMAHAEAATCAAATAGGNYGVAQEKFKVKSKCNANDETLAKIKKWWTDGAKKQTNQEQVADNDNFSNMANAASIGFACTYQYCSGELNSVCFYNEKLPGVGANLYEPGQNGKYCDNCKQLGGGAKAPCVDALCQVPFEQQAPEGKQCTQNQQTAKLMTDELRDTALYMHNYYRRLLASGWAKDGQIEYARPAVSMPALTYDCALEDKIMTDLKNCGNDAVNTGSPQNFKASSAFQDSRENVFQQVIEEWWKPLETTGIKDNLYKDSMKDTDLQNYVNMAYQGTKAVGCGVQQCEKSGKMLVQCAYATDSPIDDGDPIYTTGKTCSKCNKLAATPKCSPLGGLCVP